LPYYKKLFTMKITFLLPPVSLAGGIKVAAIYAAALVRNGHQVVIVSPPPRGISLRRKIKSLLSGKGWPKTVRVPPSHLDGFGLDHRSLDTWRPIVSNDVPDADVVIATWWETAEWAAQLSPEKGAKVYFIQHYEVFPYLPRERVLATYRLPMKKIVIANWLKVLMNDTFADPNVTLVPNSVDRAQFHAPPRGKQVRPTIGFLYGDSSIKGVDWTLQVIQRLTSKIVGLRVIAFGSSSPTNFPHWNGDIEFHQSPPQDTLRDIYAQCDVWLTASRSEGFNLPAMEAMACRTPVVATCTGWPEEAIVQHINGVLVDVGDVDGLTAGVEWALTLSDPDWHAVSAAAFDTVANCSWERSAQMFEEVLLTQCQPAIRPN
jgi:glycosyltransferase involved in cell wall biosynthesis